MEGIEQVSLERLFQNAVDTFEGGMLSIGARIILFGTVSDDQSLISQYLGAKGKRHLLDQRRRLSGGERSELEELESYATEVVDYVKWARSRGAQPIAQEAVVSYCVHFENCLKGIAVSFWLAQESQSDRLAAQIFVPGPDLTKAYRLTRGRWKYHREEKSKANASGLQSFFEHEIALRNPLTSEIALDGFKADAWRNCEAAFQLRNAIVHSLGRPSQQIELDGRVFHPGWGVELTAQDLRSIERSFKHIIHPFTMMARL